LGRHAPRRSARRTCCDRKSAVYRASASAERLTIRGHKQGAVTGRVGGFALSRSSFPQIRMSIFERRRFFAALKTRTVLKQGIIYVGFVPRDPIFPPAKFDPRDFMGKNLGSRLKLVEVLQNDGRAASPIKHELVTGGRQEVGPVRGAYLSTICKFEDPLPEKCHCFLDDEKEKTLTSSFPSPSRHTYENCLRECRPFGEEDVLES